MDIKRKSPYRHTDGSNCWTENCSREQRASLSDAASKGDVEKFLRLRAAKDVNSINRKTDQNLVLSNGVMVLKGEFQAGDFVQNFNTRYGHNSYYVGSWDELCVLVKANKDDFSPGTGSVDNDVILVNVPPAGFFTSITKVDDTNKHLAREEEYVRQEGEAPVVTRRITGIKPPAKVVQIVCYRADVLAKDNNRTTDAEWEIVAVLAQDQKNVPMHPATMLRNSNHEKGGTYREYTEQQWADAYTYWSNHAYIEEVEPS